MHLPTQCEGYIIIVRNIEIWRKSQKMSLKLRVYGLLWSFEDRFFALSFYKTGKEIAQQKKEIRKFRPFSIFT